MRCVIWVGLLALAVAGAFAAGFVVAEEEKRGGDPGMDEWMRLNRPGEKHEVLEAFAGTFDVVTKLHMQPGARPLEAKGVMTSEWILDGRYLLANHETGFAGQPLEGLTLLGHDNLRGVFQNVYLDSMSTQIWTSEGTLSGDGKTLTLIGSMLDPTDPGHRFKLVYRLGKDRIDFEFFDVSGEGAEQKQMEAVYTRRQGSPGSR